tara:strand:- start:6024 stop:6803 length:780 start_codon:yes stop_codon:yes gene_type:complete
MDTLITTALFDIKRDNHGDGRTIDDYLSWFGKTLKLKCDMIIYTEERFKDFILEKRKCVTNKTYIKIQKLEGVPFYKNNDKMKEIITSDSYLNKMSDTSRVECFLSEYNVIQYSKFGWLKNSSEEHRDYHLHFWMDAGCSRFFDNFDMNQKWPNENNISIEKFTIQGNENFINGFEKMKIEEYIWDNNCMLVGTLFGGNQNTIKRMYGLINKTYDYFLENNCINNEQFALAILGKQYPELFDIRVKLHDGHLPLFKMLG